MAASLRRALSAAGALALLAADSGAAPPLQITNATPRAILVQLESSSAPDAVAQSFGGVFPATYSATGNVGTVVISAATHEAMYAGFFPAPAPGSFQPYVIEIDLTTHHATSQPTSGGFQSGPLTQSFSRGALTTNGSAGVVVSGVPPFACTSQMDVDNLCAFVPLFCGKTCSIVSGSAYATGSGKLNLVGNENVSGCDGGVCQGPFTYFTPSGDLKLSEAITPSVPALAPWAIALLLVALVAAAHVASRSAASRA